VTRLLALLALVLAFPAAARAQQGETNAPPGNSAIDEYVETVPSASGNRPARNRDSAPAPLPADERTALEQQGPDGALLADLIDSTSPTPRTMPPAETRTGDAAPAPAPAPSATPLRERDTPSPLESTFVAAAFPNDGGGLGWFFPFFLGASLAGAVALTVLRRRPLRP
jgi:hypothetical protein